ncbi:MAG: acyl--CoA ligase [Firmicutes bacterium]|nr:acyl--CoA ligase [Bacillota bacterium]
MDLKEYKKKIANLSVNEKKLRDLYLRDLALGKVQGPPTGYASIDKPWLKYYSESQILANSEQMTCYEALVERVNKTPNAIAIEYFGNKITFRDLLKNVDKVACAYKGIGVDKGDIVTFMVVNAPEVVYSFYALNKLGAIPNMIDLRSNPKGITNYLNEVNSDFLVSLDLCYGNVEQAICDTNIKKVILLSGANSAPFALKFLDKISKINNRYSEKYIKWDDFVKTYSRGVKTNAVEYEKNYPAVMVHTGGTTGVPKGVLLSNDNLNSVVHQVSNCLIEIKENDKFLNVLVPFVAYGLALGMHAPVSLGWDSILIPKFSPEDIIKLMKKNNPSVIMGIQTYYEPLLNVDSINYSNVKAMLMGGMPTKEEFEKKMNNKILANNGNITISKGYSMTEASSCATCSFNTANEIGSNGIPLVDTVIASFDPVSGEELPIETLGEICIYSPTVMIGYYNNEVATDDVLKLHDDGKVWIHSGDIGYVSKDGFIYIKDRIKRMIIRSGFKVFPSEIENVFLKHPLVEACAVVAVDDIVDDKAPFAHIVLKSNNDIDETTIEKELDEFIVKEGLPDYFKPVNYNFRDSLPLTNIGKVDFVALENENKGKVLKKTSKT